MEFVERDPEGRADFGGLGISDKTLEVLLTTYTDEKSRYYFKDETFEGHYNTVKAELGDKEYNFFSPTLDERFWLVSASSDVDPGSVYLFDTQDQSDIRGRMNANSNDPFGGGTLPNLPYQPGAVPTGDIPMGFLLLLLTIYILSITRKQHTISSK